MALEASIEASALKLPPSPSASLRCPPSPSSSFRYLRPLRALTTVPRPVVERTGLYRGYCPSVAFDRSSAPKDCVVTAWFEEPGRDSSIQSEKVFILGEFSYDLEKEGNAQTFKVERAVSGVVNVVRLIFSSNHGSSSHTCIYRFRVHGFEPNPLNVAGQG